VLSKVVANLLALVSHSLLGISVLYCPA
jgi:hypothetical protein